MKKIFKKFEKLERKGITDQIEIQGSGLGLYISKEIVKLHEGKLWVESQGRNKGCTFNAILPLE
ncbi:MAG: ATP-binding protein [Promethearchaeota archaeon]